jgi:hypothetical protein
LGQSRYSVRPGLGHGFLGQALSHESKCEICNRGPRRF